MLEDLANIKKPHTKNAVSAKISKKKRLCNLHLKKKILPNLQKILKRTLLEKDPKLSLFSQIKRLHQKNLSRLPY